MSSFLLKLTTSMKNLNIRPPCTSICVATYTTNFFNKFPADALWNQVTSVSNAGKKRGRGKNVSRRNIKDLNKGQVIGLGKANILWPGLSAPIIRGKELVERQQLPEDPEREKKLAKLRDQMGRRRYKRISPIDRGWSGKKLPGRSIGSPDPLGPNKFEDFDCKVLELKTIATMKGQFGRVRRVSAFTVVGNGKGLAGFAQGKAIEGRSALRKSKNRAAQKLIPIKIFRNHTVLHDFFTQFGATKIVVSQRPEGHGLICHRAIKTICEVVGIKDIHAKVEGSMNVNHITKAFFLGLIKQKTHQQMAEEKRLHLVEFCPENGNFPNVLASPAKCRTAAELNKDEILDFTQYCLEGRVVLQRKKFPPFYVSQKGYQLYLKKQEKLRGKDETRVHLLAKYGKVRSFLADKYPECVACEFSKSKRDQETQEEYNN